MSNAASAHAPTPAPRRRAMLACLVSWLIVGCGSTLSVVRQTNPSPMHGATLFLVAPTQVAGAIVSLNVGGLALFGVQHREPLEEHVGRYDPEHLAQINGGLIALDQALAHQIERPRRNVAFAVSNAVPPGAFVVQAQLLVYQPESQSYSPSMHQVVASGAMARFRVQFFAADGRSLDEIQVLAYERGMHMAVLQPEAVVFQRLGESLGIDVNQYLNERTR